MRTVIVTMGRFHLERAKFIGLRIAATRISSEKYQVGRAWNTYNPPLTVRGPQHLYPVGPSKVNRRSELRMKYSHMAKRLRGRVVLKINK